MRLAEIVPNYARITHNLCEIMNNYAGIMDNYATIKGILCVIIIYLFRITGN